jgi:hypothetical protein
VAIVGYALYGADNHGYFYKGSQVSACETCGLVLDANWMSPTFVPPRSQYDLSHTYDGVTIVGERLADLIRTWPGVTLDPLTAAPNLSRLMATQVVKFDLDRGKPTQAAWCDTCHRYSQVATGKGRWIEPGGVLLDGLSRTDLVVGSAFDRPRNRMLQHPFLVVNHEYWALLAGMGVQGRPVEVVSPSVGEGDA